MAQDPKDRPGSEYDDDWRPGGISKDEARDMEARAVAGADQDRAAAKEESTKLWNATGGDKDDEKSADARSGKNKQDDTVGQGFSNKDPSRFSRLKLNLPKQARNKLAIALATGTIAGAVAIFGGMFSFLNVFKLDHFLQNVEKRGYMRYQVDLDNRSTKWIQAYMQLRLGEIEDPDPNANIKDRDNVLFRANRVDTNNPAVDWYKTLRTNKFEQNVFEKNNIKFTSVAVKQPDGSVRLRPGKIEISDRTLNFDVSGGELSALDVGDVNKLNGRIQDFVDITVFGDNGVGGDKEARREIKQVVNNETRPWEVIKRRQIRKNIQNMIGVRDWRFFEKTRDKVAEKKINMRNKIINKALPEDTKSGKMARCLFGLESCSSSKDPTSKANRASPSGSTGSGSDELSVDKDSETIGKQLGKKFIEKGIPLYNFGSMLAMFIHVNENIKNGSLVDIVVSNKGKIAAGLSTTYFIARDQLKTGEVSGIEMNEFMQATNNIGKNDAWTGPLSGYKTGSRSGVAYAAEKLGPNAADQEEYCSEEYQEKLKKGEVDKNQKADICPSTKIGSAEKPDEIQHWWKYDTPGKYLGPILDVANTGGIVGGVFGFFDSLMSKVTTPAVKLFLSASGLDKDQEKLSEYASTEINSKLGGGSIVDTDTPPPVDGIVVAEGTSWLAEAAMRWDGGAITNPQTSAAAEKRVAAYQKEQSETQTFSQKYFALSNPKSVASNQLYAFANSEKSTSLASIVSSVFKSVGSIPSLITTHVNAADKQVDDGYSAARYAGIDTYDLPLNNCPKPLDATPQNVTNADDLGVIPAQELEWELVSDKVAWADRLSDIDEDTALQIYNCGAMDNTVRGGLGALKGGYQEKNAYESSQSSGSGSSNQGSVDPGAMVNPDDLGKSSDNIQCAQGTKDLGVVVSRYTGQYKKESGPMKIRLCQIPDIPGTGNDIHGAQISGGAVVEARVSGAWAALAAKAKQDGIQLGSSSSFRLADSCGGTGDGTNCATPGNSAHQTGWAIDLLDTGGFTATGSSTSCSGRMTANTPQWKWMKENAESFGIKQYSRESWHWDFLPMTNRCGTNDG